MADEARRRCLDASTTFLFAALVHSLAIQRCVSSVSGMRAAMFHVPFPRGEPMLLQVLKNSDKIVGSSLSKALFDTNADEWCAVQYHRIRYTRG
jgi:hypothetical protein